MQFEESHAFFCKLIVSNHSNVNYAATLSEWASPWTTQGRLVTIARSGQYRKQQHGKMTKPRLTVYRVQDTMKTSVSGREMWHTPRPRHY